MMIFMLFPFILVLLVCIISLAGNNGRKTIKPNENISSKYKDIAYKILANDPELAVARDKQRNVSKVTGILFYISLAGIIIAFISRNRASSFFFLAFIIAIIVSIFVKKDTILFSKIVPKIVKSYREDLEYNHFEGVNKDIYNEAKFEYYDRYTSDDLIKGFIKGNNFEMAEVHTENRHTDSKGHTHYTTIFQGTFVKIELSKSYDGLLTIVNNRIKLFNRDEYITIDNEEFEKIYDVFTDDKIKAMRLLTPDVTTKMIDVYNDTGLFCEIKIKGKFLYMRLYTGPLFSFSLSNPEKESEKVAYSIAVLDTVFKVIENFVDEIERFDV